MIRTLFFIFIVNQIWAVPVDKQSRDKQYFSLEQLIPLEARFAQRSFGGNWISENEFLFSKPGEPGLFKYDVTTQSDSLFIPKSIFDVLNTTDVTVSPDRLYLLARSDPLLGFRYSSTARFALYELATNQSYLIANHTRLQYCAFGGQGHSVGYVLDNNVYYLNDTNNNIEEVKLTTDGVPGIIYNGVPDWVYEEEVFGSNEAMWFSDDATRMAIASFNDTNVEYALYSIYGKPGDVDNQYTTYEQLKYPKVGTKNPFVYLRVINLKNSPSWITLNPPQGLGSSNEDVILGSVTWASANEVAAVWLNRRQNRSILVICNADTGSCVNEVTRAEPNGWIDIETPKFNGNQFIYIDYTNQGSSGDWPHVVMYTRGNSQPVAITNGSRTVTNIIGWEKDLNKIYYLSTLEEEPWKRHLFVAGSKDACLSCTVSLSSGKPCRYAGAIPSKKIKAFAMSCQGTGPSNTWIYSASTDLPVAVWRDNAELSQVLEDFYLPQQINLRIPVAGGFEATVKLFLPPDLDYENGTDKAYPMVVNIYTGPGSARVTDVFNLGYQTYMSTNRSIIYAYVEGRGSGLKGKDMLFSVNDKLGTFEVEDVINVTRILAETYNWIDGSNIGVWGWSYGGYASSMALTRDQGGVFKCGIAVAPVTSWLYYDTIYTERYMGTPQENPAGYAESDVTKRARFLRNRNFLMMHGNADDNVHYQNAMALARELQTLDIDFELMSYPDEAHSLSGVSRHVYHTIDHFWTRCFTSTERVFV